jgi:hypothetical protein
MQELFRKNTVARLITGLALTVVMAAITLGQTAPAKKSYKSTARSKPSMKAARA